MNTDTASLWPNLNASDAPRANVTLRSFHHANRVLLYPRTLAARVQVKRRLENLDSIGVVTVERNSTLSYGAYEWTVMFETELGDLPMLGVTAGRLTGGASSAVVTEKQAGSAAALVFDGSGMASVKKFTATGLVEDALYAFKVRHSACLVVC